MDFSYRVLKKYTDKRGFLAEFLKPSELSFRKPVQFFLATIEPCETRGGHYHSVKDEWIILAYGRVRFLLEDVVTKKRQEFLLDACGRNSYKIKIGRGVAHLLENTSRAQEALIVGYLTCKSSCRLKDRWEHKKYEFK